MSLDIWVITQIMVQPYRGSFSREKTRTIDAHSNLEFKLSEKPVSKSDILFGSTCTTFYK